MNSLESSVTSNASLTLDTATDCFVLTVEMVQFYLGSVITVLHDLHKAGIAYRNLKAENILIDDKGYVKMTGFGWAKRFPFSDDDLYVKIRTHTLCGTPEYMAPEIILQTGHNASAGGFIRFFFDFPVQLIRYLYLAPYPCIMPNSHLTPTVT